MIGFVELSHEGKGVSALVTVDTSRVCMLLWYRAQEGNTAMCFSVYPLLWLYSVMV